MTYELSPQTEQYLANIVAGGLYSTKQAALEAAVAALREKNQPLAPVPEAHLDAVEEVLASTQTGQLREFTDAGWSRLRNHAHHVAGRIEPGP